MAPRLVLKQHARTWNHPTQKTDTFWLFTQEIGEHRGILVAFLEWDNVLESTTVLAAVPAWQQTMRHCAASIAENHHPQYQFEQMLEALNQQWETLGKTAPKLLPQLRVGIALLLHEQFFFSGHGAVSALFLRQVAAEKFRVFDLALNVMSEAGSDGHRRPLRTVLDGDWQSHDAFILGSSHLPQALPLESLHPWFTQLPPVTVSESISQAFHPSNLALFLAQMAPEKETLTGIEGEMGSVESLTKLHETIIDTQQEAGVHHASHTQDWLQTVRSVFTSLTPATQRLRALLHPLLRRSRALSKKLTAKIPQLVWQFRKRSRTSLGAKVTLIHRVPTLVRRSANTLRWGGAVLCLLVLGSLGWHWRNAAKHDRLFGEAVSQAQQQITEAQNALIYKNETTALTLNTSAATALAPLTARTTAQETQLRKIKDSLHEQKARLEHRFTPTIATTSFTDTPLALLNESVLLANGSVWDTHNQIPSPITAPNGGTVVSAIASGNGFLTLTQDGLASSYRPSPGFLPSTTSSWTAAPQDWFSYADRVYSLGQNGIWRRLQKADGSLTPASTWLTSETSIDPGASLAVDMSVWVVEPTRLRQFQAGQEKIIAPSIAPSLERVKDIYTSTKTPWLFLLDQGGGGRVIILDKTSLKVIAQFVDERFTNATRFFVNEANATVAVVSGNTLLQFPVSGVK